MKDKDKSLDYQLHKILMNKIKDKEKNIFSLNHIRVPRAAPTWYILGNYYTNFNLASLGATAWYKPKDLWT